QKQPASIVGLSLFPYQLEGLQWLVRMNDNGVGMILGDEMGLGKTIQTISLLAVLAERKETKGTHLVVCPLSVLGTWESEFRRWCPSLNVRVLHGAKPCRDKVLEGLRNEEGGTCDVMITTYEMMVAEGRRFALYHYLILDEAHKIKNDNSLAFHAVSNIRSVNKILLTGTPLQNNMHELWVLVNFLFPDLFADAELFDAAFSSTWEGVKFDFELMRAAHKLLQPLMLRRLKKDVQQALPKKTVYTIWCPLTSMQKFWYKQFLLLNQGSIAHLKDARISSSSMQSLMNLLMQLRKVCCHPYLFPDAETDPTSTDANIVTNSTKMMVLHRLIDKLHAQGRKLLVYSQFTRMLDVIQDYCELVGHKYLRLDGSTASCRRKYEIQLFNSGKSHAYVYLLSTRSGALGITLTGADTVVMMDSDWNPTWDKQAQDRVHRIGQKREVTIYQLLAANTVEERIFQRAQQKVALNQIVLQ
ncbi:hypothetical protein GUITHDRAFT_56212, partial [Guillardia theta CCMP2712]